MKYSESLKKNRDFQLVYKSGTSKANRYLVMYVRENQLEKNRVGISVSKKVGNSVVRHHLARLIRESYRLNEEKFKCGYDCNCSQGKWKEPGVSFHRKCINAFRKTHKNHKKRRE